MLSWHLIGCAEVSSGRDCQQNMSKPMIFAGHRSRIVSWPAWGNSHTHRAVSTSHVLYADMMDFGEHGPGPLSRSMSHSHHGHPRHKSHLGMLAGVITFVAVFHVVKRCCKRRRKQKPTILSQLSQLSAQSDTMPNPLLQGRHNPATGPMQAAGVIPTSDPDWLTSRTSRCVSARMVDFGSWEQEHLPRWDSQAFVGQSELLQHVLLPATSIQLHPSLMYQLCMQRECLLQCCIVYSSTSPNDNNFKLSAVAILHCIQLYKSQ
jgi:hypothetical protein